MTRSGPGDYLALGLDEVFGRIGTSSPTSTVGSRNPPSARVEHGHEITSKPVDGRAPFETSRRQTGELLVVCWCERSTKLLTEAAVLAGEGWSCGRRRCLPPRE